MRPDLPSLLDDLRAEHADLRRLVIGASLDAPTPSPGWDVRDAVSHLWGSDREATRAAGDPDGFLAVLPGTALDLDGLLTGQLADGRRLGVDLLPRWQTDFDRMLGALGELDPSARVPWYGPPMSPTTFATARLMEYWAHGQDVVDGLGETRTPTARLRHICHLGVQTYRFAYAIRGLGVPGEVPRVSLVAPDGSNWQWGGGEDAVEGPAVDFCLRVTQRRHRADTGLVATGPRADAWLDLAQCFAGPPGPGRGKRGDRQGPGP